MTRQADLRLTPKDKAVIDAFLDRMPADSKNLRSDGKTLDGLWMGGSGIAVWEGSRIGMGDLGSRGAQTVQNYIRKVAPRNWLRGAALKESYELNDPGEYMRALEKWTRPPFRGHLPGNAGRVWNEMSPKDQEKILIAASPAMSRVRQDRFGNLNITFRVKRKGKLDATIYSDGSTTWLKTEKGDVYLEPKDAASGIIAELMDIAGLLKAAPPKRKVIRRRPGRPEVVLGSDKEAVASSERIAGRYLMAVRIPRATAS